jgi:hypothetical protein
VNLPTNSRGVDLRLYVLVAVPTLLGIAHHVDHVVRGNHVGWPVVPAVNSFTYSLLVYPVIAAGLYLTLTDRVGVRYWVVTAAFGAAMMWFLHFSPWAVEPPRDVVLPYADPWAGILAFAVLVGLVMSLLATTGYATYRLRTWEGRG